jgi:hypothetical protein
VAFKVSRPLAVLGEPQVDDVQGILTEDLDPNTGACNSVDLAPPGWAADARVLMDAFQDHAPEDPVDWDEEVLAQEASGRLAAVFTNASSGRTLRVQSCSFRIGIYKVKAGLLD